MGIKVGIRVASVTAYFLREIFTSPPPGAQRARFFVRLLFFVCGKSTELTGHFEDGIAGVFLFSGVHRRLCFI